MTYRILNNKRGTSTHVLFTANTSLTIVGNSSTSAIATDNEVLTGASILRAWCGSPSGNGSFWTVRRGANTVFVFDSTAFMDFAGNGLSINVDSGATLVANINGGNLTGTLILELKKIGTGNTSGPIFLPNSEYDRQA